MQSAHSRRGTSNPDFLPVDMAIPVPMKIILHRPPWSALQHPFCLNSPIQQNAIFLSCIFNTLSFFQGSSWPRCVRVKGCFQAPTLKNNEAGCWNSQPWTLGVWQCPYVAVTWPVILALNWSHVQSLCFQSGSSGQRVPVHSYRGGMGCCFQPRTMEQAMRGTPGDLRAALSCPVSSCPHAATMALGTSPPVGTCVAPVLHQNSGWRGLGQQVQKHPKAASPFSSSRFLSWPWNGFRSFLDQ